MKSPLGLPDPDRTSLVAVNRSRLRIWEWGDADAPPVLFVHGAHDHGRMWDEFAPMVAASLHIRAVCVDLRGHGDSGGLSSGHMWITSALDLALLARSLGSSVGFIGHSFGAGQSMFTAGVWPELVPWVVNLDGLGGGGDGPPDDWDIAEDAARSFANAERVLLSPPRVYATQQDMVERRAGVNVRLPRPWVEHLVVHGSRPTGDGSGWQWKADPVFRSGWPGDWDAEWDEAESGMSSVPVLVLTGAEEDTWSDHAPEVVARNVARIPNARHEVVEGAGHYVHIEQPEAVLASVERFVKEVDVRW